MAKPTKEEIDQWNARMAEPDEPDEEDFEVVLFSENGTPVGTMPYSKAKAHFRKHGIDLDDPADIPAGNGTAQSGDANSVQSPAGTAGAGAAPGTSRSRASSKYFGKPGAVQPMGTGLPADGAIPPDGAQVR